MYTRNAWYVAGWSSDLEPGKPFAIRILGEPIVIYRAVGSDRLVALEDRCVHRLAPLSLGRCEGENLRCMYHGLLFGPDGVTREIPGQDLIPPKARVRAYPVVERASWLWVWLGDADKADEALIPPSIGPDHPDYIMGQGFLDYDAEARLINDNLLDFSHLTYVHAASFEAGDQFAHSLPKIETLDRGIRYSRWAPNARGPVGRRSEDLLDNYMSYEFLVPGVLLMWSGGFPAGTAEACAFGPPDRSQACANVTFTSQAVTPMTDGTARYFFCWGPHRDHGDEKLRDLLINLALQAFNEDKVMIEAQHKIIALTPNPTVMPTAHDRPVTIFNRMVERMAKDQSTG
ncbi:aromatic ring-hydroxylating dioxygenase subunit alpha [Alteraurantiacibacter buctensis]|uniref:Rieske 2Fe-2S domain-containing protein n=1 Tax=Alteraurantiacibacter buctensis TaxID=1503981 RepID=A0A844YTW0_9SPHN|nr:aromatic ring-hydroxylating dioxygenase subunit alpha [Alteraurantiacibacter buctensis]MXO71755.1 Rieske 2Fe-2S domain-containing protein [Alteraurantiacibacter buctensis]